MVVKRKNVPTPAIVIAAESGNQDGVRRAIDAGESINSVDRDGRSALHLCVLQVDVPLIRILLDLGIDVSLGDRMGWTALHFSARDHTVHVAEILLDAGCPVDIEDKFGNTPLSTAVFESRGRGEMITLLLKRGADRYKENKAGVSPKGLAESIANYNVRQWFQ